MPHHSTAKEGLFLKRYILTGCTILFSIWLVSSPFAEDAIRIGAIISVTGPGASRGEIQKNTILMMQEQINYRGGIWGKKLDVIIYDDEMDVNLSILAAEKLLERDDVVAVIGPTTSGNTLSLVDTFERASIPLVSLASSEKIVVPTKKWVFKTSPSDRIAVSRLLTHAKSKGVRKIAILTELDGIGQAGRIALKELIPQMGFSLVADQVYRSEDSDMTAQLIKIEEAGPDTIICWGRAPGAAVIARNRVQLEMKFRLYTSHHTATRKFLALSGKSSEGIVLPAERLIVADQISQDHPQKEPIFNYIKEYESRFGTFLSPAGCHARDALSLLLRAIDMGSSYDPADIRNNLERVTGFPGTGGIFNFSYGDHGGLDESAFEMVVIRKGKFLITR